MNINQYDNFNRHEEIIAHENDNTNILLVVVGTLVLAVIIFISIKREEVALKSKPNADGEDLFDNS